MKQAVVRKCKFCGKLFKTTNSNQVYCSKKCYQDHHREYLRSWRKNNKEKQRGYFQKWLNIHKEEYRVYRREYMREYMRKYYKLQKQKDAIKNSK